MTEHRWSGWPGAWCLDCGIDDARELCVATHDVAFHCAFGHFMDADDPFVCLDGHPIVECPEHQNAPCPKPGANEHNPYVR